MLSLILVLAVAGAFWRTRRRILLTGATGLLLVSAWGLLPAWLLGRLQHAWPEHYTDWGTRNAIVLLGAGTRRLPDDRLQPATWAYPRILQALALYRSCKATQADCLLLISGGDPQRHGESEAHNYALELLRLGVSATDMKLETRSLDTRQNAEYSRPILAAYAPDRVVLVSSAYHLRRAQWNFRAQGMATRPVPADYLRAHLGWLPEGSNLALTDLALHEYLGLAELAFLYR